jgi:hypothetical protein
MNQFYRGDGLAIQLRNASTSAAEHRQEIASNVQPGLALPAIIRPIADSMDLTTRLCPLD